MHVLQTKALLCLYDKTHYIVIVLTGTGIVLAWFRKFENCRSRELCVCVVTLNFYVFGGSNLNQGQMKSSCFTD